MKKTLANFIYQTIYQVGQIIIPIITIPIVSSALGPAGVGQYNFVNSVANYFVLVAGLGVSLYGNREIARVRDDRHELSKVFWEIFMLKAGMTVLMLAGYLILFSFTQERIFYYVQSLTILAVFFDVSWFFMGIEDFKKTAIANLFAKCLMFLLIVLFVRQADDLLLYILIQGVGVLLSNLIVWLYLVNQVKLVAIHLAGVLRHVFFSLKYFTPQVAIILYTNLNKTLLGLIDTSESVGFYTNSTSIISIICTIITTIDLVLLPRMSHLFKKNQKEKMLRILSQSLHIQLFFSIAIMFGLWSTYDKLIPWFFGEEFLFINRTVPLLVPIVVIMPLGLAISRQYLLPIGNTKEFNLSVFAGACISSVINLATIPFLGIYGAILAQLGAETFVTIVRTKAFVKATHFKFERVRIIKYIVAGIMMLFVVRIVTAQMSASLLTNIIQILLGFTVYMLVTFCLKVNVVVELFGKISGIKMHEMKDEKL